MKSDTSKPLRNSPATPVRTGILMGLVMALFLLIIEINSVGAGTYLGLKLSKFLIVAFILGGALMKLKETMDDKRYFFQKGFFYGIKSVFVASILLLFVHFVTMPWDNFSIATFTASLAEVTEVPHTGEDVMLPFVTSGMLFLETMIFGFLVNIGLLAFLKDYGRTP